MSVLHFRRFMLSSSDLPTFSSSMMMICGLNCFIWVALPDVADTQVDRLLQAELSVKLLSGNNSVDYA